MQSTKTTSSFFRFIRLFQTRRVTIALFLAISALSRDGHAQCWDATADFSASNPNPPWSYGWTAGLGTPLNIYPRVRYEDGLNLIWDEPSINILNTPSIWKNGLGHIQAGVPPGYVTLHPGCHANEFSVLRWTVPAAGTYHFSVQFFLGDFGDTSAYVLLNSQANAPLFVAASTGSNPSFSTTLTLNTDDTVDYVVGTAGDDCYGDNTPLIVQIRKTGSDCDSDLDGDGVLDGEDVCPLENAAGFDADGDGCIDTLEGLRAFINSQSSDSISKETRPSLYAKIDAARRQRDTGNICTAVQILKAFKAEVEGQRGKKITDATATLLIDYANNVIAKLITSLPAGEVCP